MVHLHTNYTIHRDISQSSLHFMRLLLHEQAVGLFGGLKDLTSEDFFTPKLVHICRGVFLNVGEPAKNKQFTTFTLPVH